MSRVSVMKFTGAGMTDFLHALLFGEAIRLLRGQGGVRRFVSGQDAVGWVKTRRDTAGFGTIYGIRFAATVEHEGGKTEVTFLVNDPGAWFDPNDRQQNVEMRYAPISDAAFIRYLDNLHRQQFVDEAGESPDAN